MPKVDLAKRRRIMARSKKLGHCICDPKRPCPCDVFKDQGICPCAGERPEQKNIKDVRLTQLVHNAGCASKIPPADLEAKAIISRMPSTLMTAIIFDSLLDMSHMDLYPRPLPASLFDNSNKSLDTVKLFPHANSVISVL
jgi:hypothetical protein